jgi:hypothetical protein
MLELVRDTPNWLSALSVALARPAGVRERRNEQDPWHPDTEGRPRRIADDLAWLRRAYDEPEENGLRPLTDTAAVAAWQTDDPECAARLHRLRDRTVLDAAGFLLHEAGEPALT